MTAHLHLEVVEEQYRRLQEKTEALEISEKRYRELAESLEVEVRKKTREVRDIQARLMQQSHLAAIGRLAAGIAHEINNPMGFITSNLAILSQYISELTPFLKQQQTVLSNLSGGRISRDNALSVLEAAARTSKDVDFGFIADDVPALISESREGAERIRLIVKNLRLFAQPGITDRTLVDLNRSLDATLEVLRGWIGEKVTIVRCFGDLKKISCHETQMNQALMNLILNALQAVGDSGEIRITTACEDGYVLVRIQDSGPGIPEENLASVFEPFFTTREVGEGCGLGLTVAYNIIRKYEGEIDIASSPGSGTEVWVRMPVV
jgi:signal transduction histidine kinase